MSQTAQRTPSSAPERPADDGAVFASFRRRIDEALDAHVPRGKPAALLQYPYDGNVGNHMMWVATTDYLRQRGIDLAYVAHGNNFDVNDLRRAVGGGPILFLGGVTISRLWPRHAEVKRIVAEAFPENALISLPATCLFLDDEDKRHAGALFGGHRNVTVMARDPVSGAHARDAFPPHVKVLTVPDMALRLPVQPRKTTADKPIIWLARGDAEAAGFSSPGNVHVFDWPDHATEIKSTYLTLRASGVLSRLRSSRFGDGVAGLINPSITRLYRQASEFALDYGNAVLDRGKVLVTDRMHPHIHAALRGQHVVLLPDKFGKNRAVYEYGTRDLGTVHFVETSAAALEKAQELAAG
jgi:exopolysaccharide biosynthesis predicted pyruvyltransferase EpsI